MSQMAPLIGKKLTEKIFLDRYIALCENDEFYVRKICVSHFAELCTAVGKKALFWKLVSPLLPAGLLTRVDSPPCLLTRR